VWAHGRGLIDDPDRLGRVGQLGWMRQRFSGNRTTAGTPVESLALSTLPGLDCSTCFSIGPVLLLIPGCRDNPLDGWHLSRASL
jgi:hypothetical protein